MILRLLLSPVSLLGLRWLISLEIVMLLTMRFVPGFPITVVTRLMAASSANMVLIMTGAYRKFVWPLRNLWCSRAVKVPTGVSLWLVWVVVLR